MNETSLIQFLKELGLWPLKRSGTWHYKCECFYQSIKHPRGVDRHPSGTISFDGDGESWFECFTCDTKKPFHQVIMENAARWALGNGWTAIARRMADEEERQQQCRPIRKPRKFVARIRDCNAGLKQLIEAGGLRYPQYMVEFMESKGVSAEWARKFGFCFVPAGYVDPFLNLDENGKPIPIAADSIFFPTLTHNERGNLVCAGGQARPFEGKTKKYYTMYPYSSRSFTFGEQFLSRAEGQPLFVVEGQFDVAHIMQEGFFATGIFGLHLNQPRILKIKRAKPSRVILFMDPDEAGQKVVTQNARLLGFEGLTTQIVTGKMDPKYSTTKQLQEFIDSW